METTITPADMQSHNYPQGYYPVQATGINNGIDLTADTPPITRSKRKDSKSNSPHRAILDQLTHLSDQASKSRKKRQKKVEAKWAADPFSMLSDQMEAKLQVNTGKSKKALKRLRKARRAAYSSDLSSKATGTTTPGLWIPNAAPATDPGPVPVLSNAFAAYPIQSANFNDQLTFTGGWAYLPLMYTSADMTASGGPSNAQLSPSVTGYNPLTAEDQHLGPYTGSDSRGNLESEPTPSAPFRQLKTKKKTKGYPLTDEDQLSTHNITLHPKYGKPQPGMTTEQIEELNRYEEYRWSVVNEVGGLFPRHGQTVDTDPARKQKAIDRMRQEEEGMANAMVID